MKPPTASPPPCRRRGSESRPCGCSTGYISPRGLTVFAFELVLIAGSVLYAMHLHGGVDTPGAIWKVFFITVLCQLSFYYHDLYDLTVVNSPPRAAGPAAAGERRGVAAACGAVRRISPPHHRPRRARLVGVLLRGGGRLSGDCSSCRWGARAGCRSTCSSSAPARRARIVAREVLDQHDYAYRIVGFIDDDPAMIGRSIVNPKVIGTHADIVRLVREQRVNRIIVGLADRRGRLPIEELLEAKLQGVRIEEPETTYERLTGKIMLDELKPSWLIFSDGFRARRAHARASSAAIDVVLALVGLVLAAAADGAHGARGARSIQPGRSCYAQERVGEHGRRFMVYKFRSMRTDAERRHAHLGPRPGRSRHAGRPLHPPDAPRRDAAALERAARRHELRRARVRNGRSSSSSWPRRSRSTGSATP